MISLSVGQINIDYGKNEYFQNHAHLFQQGDRSVNEYDYVNDDGTPHIEVQEALRRPLSRVAPRLELLGYTLPACEAMLVNWIADEEGGLVASMEAFRHALRSFEWRERGEYVDFDEAIREAYAAAPGANVPEGKLPSMIAWERRLDPYLVLRVLADMPEYSDLPVCWNYADVKDGGYVDDSNFDPSPPAARWMLVTEGTSDAFVLARSLEVTHPDIADFFDFIDMSTGNPFPGVGSIVSFCRGLSRVRYTGHMLVVLDNDAAGRAALAEIQTLGMPTSFVATCLPDLEELRAFKTLGPAGKNLEDINGRASSIECFLDFRKVQGTPAVRWTTYMSKQSAYQGELVSKDAYVADFKARFGKEGTEYDTSKLIRLWDHLISRCTSSTTASPYVA
ncbi:HEPN/Toprim-associated domain-containing protein [Methylibium rhizosphaerae]|uniref:HEPN/Toprim-associated domain-containing protein n=1 Tax=Methylibium rhizosphaerae TaxID=2570323 RepID=UPI0015E2CD37|nr:HEPN/Toprim-associated domain-containing protein [Methylibium rhizosphaerae]